MENELLLKVLSRIDVRALLIEDLLVGLIYKKIDELVLDSENTIDDAMAQMLKPLLQKELDKFIVSYLEGLKK